MLRVLVAPPGHREQDGRPGRHFSVPGSPYQPSERVSRLESGDYPLGASEQLERVQDFGVLSRPVPRPADLAEVGVLRPDAGVIEACRDRFSLEDLAELVLEEVRPHAMEDPRDTSWPHRGPAGRFDTDKLGRGADKSCERPGRVAAPADTGDDEIGAPPNSRWHCRRASSPITAWNSRTIQGNGCGPMTDPMQ